MTLITIMMWNFCIICIYTTLYLTGTVWILILPRENFGFKNLFLLPHLIIIFLLFIIYYLAWLLVNWAVEYKDHYDFHELKLFLSNRVCAIKQNYLLREIIPPIYFHQTTNFFKKILCYYFFNDAVKCILSTFKIEKR